MWHKNQKITSIRIKDKPQKPKKKPNWKIDNGFNQSINQNLKGKKKTERTRLSKLQGKIFNWINPLSKLKKFH